jgi:hypothetical protein
MKRSSTKKTIKKSQLHFVLEANKMHKRKVIDSNLETGFWILGFVFGFACQSIALMKKQTSEDLS